MRKYFTAKSRQRFVIIRSTLAPLTYIMDAPTSNKHYGDVIIGSIASQITSLTIVYSSVYSGADQRTHQSSASLAFVRGIHRRPVNSPHKGSVTRKCFHLLTSSWMCAWVSLYYWLSNVIWHITPNLSKVCLIIQQMRIKLTPHISKLGSPLAQLMACCLMTTSHCLDQWGLTISRV